MKNFINSLLLSLVFVFMGCKQEDSTKKNYLEFSFSTLSGKKLLINKSRDSLEMSNQNRPVLLFLIQAECDECFQGIEHIQRVYEDYVDQIVFIPILSDNQHSLEILKQEAMSLQKKYQLGFEFFYATDGASLLQTYQPQTNSPFFVLYDSKLQKIREYEGFIPEEMLEFEINQVLQMQEAKEL